MTKKRVKKLKTQLMGARSTLLDLMETYDVYNWQSSIKYLNADLTAIMALIQATVAEVNELEAEHADILEEYIEELG